MIMRPASSSSSFGCDKMRVMRPLSILACIALVLMVGQLQIRTIGCIQSQQQQRQDSLSLNQQPAPDQVRARQGQASGGYGDFISSSSSSGAAASDSLINLGGGGQSSGYLNNKRARKMSAFMPMRGRKDGRDYRELDNGPSSGWPIVEYLPMRESDESDASILRLAMAANQAAFQGASGVATPRSFVDQMAARRAQQQPQSQVQSQSQSQSQNGNGGGEMVFEPATSGSLFAQPSPPQATVMQAKLRRAFHPMRGKKFDSLFPESMFADDQTFDQTDLEM